MKRIKYLDELRVFAMILIIALHVIAIFNYKYISISTLKFAFTVLLSSFTRVGVPIFFMITGALMLTKKEEKYSVFFKKRVMKLVIAYVFFSCIYYFYQVIMGIKLFNLFELIREITSSQVEYHLWFMPVIISIYILIPFLKKLVDNLKREDLKRLIVIIFITVNTFYCINAITNVLGYPLLSSFQLPKLFGYINYLFIGYYLFTSDYKINRKLVLLSILSILLIPMCTVFISRGSFQELFLDSLSIFVVAPSILTFLLFKNKKNNHFSKFVEVNSNNVFYIYLSHVLFLNIIYNQIELKVLSTGLKQDLIIIFLLWISVIIVSFAFSYIYVKVKELIKKHKDTISKVLIKGFYIVLILLFVLIIINFLLNKYNFIKLDYLLFIIGLFTFILFFYILNKYKEQIFKNKIIKILLIVLYLSFQILIAYMFMVRPTWDFGQVYDIAVNFAKSSNPTFGSAYLYVCSNNIMFTVILEIIFKLFYLIGIKNHFLEIGIIINIIMIDLSIIYTYLLINKINNKYSKPFLIFILIFSPLIFYIPIFYTDTISMPFIIIPIYYLYLYFYNKQKLNYLIIASILIGLGSIIKPTTLIILVALLIYFVLVNNKKNDYYIFLSILIGLIVLPLLCQRVFINHFFDKDSLYNYRIPTVHYLLIGMENNGEYSEKRYKEINSYVGEDIKIKVTKKKIKNRINEMIKNKELLSFYNRKIAYTWTDGTFFSFAKLGREPIHKKYLKFVYSENGKNSIYWLMSNVEWFIIITLMLIGIIKRKYLPKEIKELQLLIFISIFGLFLFLLIWETRSRYLVNFIPLFLINAYLGLYAFSNYIKTKKGGK